MLRQSMWNLQQIEWYRDRFTLSTRFPLPVIIPPVFHTDTNLLPPVRCVVGPTSQHIIAASVISWDFTSDYMLG
jgi:hypothetical protein